MNTLNKTFAKCCQDGDLRHAKIMYKNHKIDISFDNYLAYRNANENFYLNIMIWLYNIDPTINIMYDIDKTLINATNYGELDILKWLYNHDPTILKYLLFECLTTICTHNNLNMLIWIHDLEPALFRLIDIDDIFIKCMYNNITCTIDYILSNSCYRLNRKHFHILLKKSNLYLCKWFHRKNVFLLQIDDFNYACENSTLSIVQWLLTINENFKNGNLETYIMAIKNSDKIIKHLYEINNLALPLIKTAIMRFNKDTNANIFFWLFEIDPKTEITANTLYDAIKGFVNEEILHGLFDSLSKYEISYHTCYTVAKNINNVVALDVLEMQDLGYDYIQDCAINN
jgi:hypothetical protein